MAETDLTIKFKVEDDGSVHLENFSTKLAQIPKHVDSMNASLSVIKWSSLVSLAEQAYNVGERVYGMAKEVASSINDIERSAKVANMTTTQYQLMAYAAKMSDVSIEELSTGMKKLSVNMDEAQKIGGPAAEKFERIGVSVKDSSGKMKTLNDIMLEIADKFSTWEDGPRKIAIAVDLFGRSGERLIPYLNQGAAGIKKFYEEAEKAGIILDEGMIAKGSELEDRFKKAEAAWDSFKKKVVVSIYEMITAADKWKGKEKEIAETYWQTGEFVPPQLAVKSPEAEAEAEREKATDLYLQMEAYYKRTQTQAPAMVDNEKDLKFYRELSLGLLKEEESTLKRIVDLQDKLNKANDDAVKIMENLGIGTKAALTQWINEDIVGEYGKLLGSKLFSPEEMKLAQEKYIAALQGAQESGAYGGRWSEQYTQMEDAISKIKSMTAEETAVGKMRTDLAAAQKELAQIQVDIASLDKYTISMHVNDDQLVTARSQVLDLRKQLTELTSQRWDVVIAVTGTGSSERPIMDKIDEIWGGFESMQGFIANMKANVEMEQISGEIARYQGLVRSAATAPHVIGFGERIAQNWIPYYESQIRALDEQKRLLASAMAAGGARAPAAAGSTPAETGAGGVSIYINSIYVTAGNETVAENLDGELADLWVKNRSKLKEVIQA